MPLRFGEATPDPPLFGVSQRPAPTRSYHRALPANAPGGIHCLRLAGLGKEQAGLTCPASRPGDPAAGDWSAHAPMPVRPSCSPAQDPHPRQALIRPEAPQRVQRDEADPPSPRSPNVSSCKRCSGGWAVMSGMGAVQAATVGPAPTFTTAAPWPTMSSMSRRWVAHARRTAAGASGRGFRRSPAWRASSAQ